VGQYEVLHLVSLPGLGQSQELNGITPALSSKSQVFDANIKRNIMGRRYFRSFSQKLLSDEKLFCSKHASLID
jgi:hypothetical protein